MPLRATCRGEGLIFFPGVSAVAGRCARPAEAVRDKVARAERILFVNLDRGVLAAARIVGARPLSAT